jgi:hypothetical protein
VLLVLGTKMWCLVHLLLLSDVAADGLCYVRSVLM